MSFNDDDQLRNTILAAVMGAISGFIGAHLIEALTKWLTQ